jgi:signal transduction histidine kinase
LEVEPVHAGHAEVQDEAAGLFRRVDGQEFLSGGVARVLQPHRLELQQVIVNLVHNAFEAISRLESGRRDVSIETTSPDAHNIQVNVTDTGPGLRPGHADEVFEPFYTTKPDGMGMGLAICRRIVAAHGGRLWVREHPDGVTFSFTLSSDAAKSPRSRAAHRVRGR